VSDQRLRELERRYLESGLPSDEADFLSEALRLGHLPERRVQLLADVGYLPARLLDGREEMTLAEIGPVGRLVRERWGQWELASLNYVLALRLLPPRQDFAHPTRLALDPALEAVAAWLERPEAEARQALSRASRALSSTELAAWLDEPAAEAIRGAFAAIVWGPSRGLTRHPSFETPRLASEVLGLEGYLAAIREDLAPRLLTP
tara:strand:+ start:1062 stop:1676 length:615 start_codon:yes stop_codon:yes gene_type:complete